MHEQLISSNKKELIDKINRLIIGQRKGFIEQYKKGKTALYWTSKSKLTDAIVNAHLEGKRTIGCFYLGKYSKFLCFDIDEKNEELLEQLIKSIKEFGVSEQDIHIEVSGVKGWHIWLFFDKPIYISDLLIFGRRAIGQLNIDKNRIELRPESEYKSRGIKLPFAIHRKIDARTTFISTKLKELKNPVQYFLEIEPISSRKFMEKIEPLLKEEIHNVKKCKVNKFVQKEADMPPLREHICTGYSLANKLIKNGMKEVEMTERKRRHYYQFFVALYYKSNGYTQQQTKEKVKEWALNELEQGRSKSSKEEISEDVDRDIEHIYAKDKKFYHKSNRVLLVSSGDIDVVKQYGDLTTQKVVWCILLLGRIFHNKGDFFFSLRQVAKMTGFSKNTVDRRIRNLILDGFISKKENGSFCYVNPKASQYHVPQLIMPVKQCYQIESSADTFTGLFEDTFEQIQSGTFKETSNRDLQLQE